MSLSKIKRGIFKNGVLLSLMVFYFSCGKDVFPPDSPGEDIFARKSFFSMAGFFLETEAWGKGVGSPENLEAMIQPVGEYGIFTGEKREPVSWVNCKIPRNRSEVDHGQAHVIDRNFQVVEHFGNSSGGLEIELQGFTFLAFVESRQRAKQ